MALLMPEQRNADQPATTVRPGGGSRRQPGIVPVQQPMMPVGTSAADAYTNTMRRLPGGAATPVGTVFTPPPASGTGTPGQSNQPTVQLPGQAAQPYNADRPPTNVAGTAAPGSATPVRSGFISTPVSNAQPPSSGVVPVAQPLMNRPVNPSLPGSAGTGAPAVAPVGRGIPGTAPVQPSGPPPVTSFGPEDNLIGTQVNPAGSSRFTGAQRNTDRARQLYGDYSLQPFEGITATEDPTVGQLDAGAINAAQRGGPNPFTGVDAANDISLSGEAARARSLASQGLEDLYSAPNRGEIAAAQLANLEEGIEDRRRTGIQDIGRAAASLGRVGSGVTTSQLGDLESVLSRDRNRSMRELASESASLEMGDRQARLDAARGTGGQFRGEDLDAEGFRQGLRQEARGERADELGYGFDTANLGLQQAGVLNELAGDIFGRGQSLREEGRGERADRQSHDAMGYDMARGRFQDFAGEESRQFGQEQGQRDELRGERDYQYGLERDAQGDRVNQRILEEQLLNQSTTRDMDRARLAAGIGFGGASPTPAMLAGAEGMYGAGSDTLAAIGAGQGARPQQQPYPGTPPFIPSWNGTPVDDLNILSPGDFYDPATSTVNPNAGIRPLPPPRPITR